MKIIHVVETLGRGGLERMVVDLAEAQVSKGYLCAIICIFNSGELAKEAVSKGIQVVVCDKSKSFDLNAMIKLRKTIKVIQPDVIHTHNAVPNYYVYFSVILMRSFCIINTRHGMGSKDPKSKLEQKYKKSLKKTKYTVAVCEAARRKFVTDKILLADKCVVVKNGIKVKNFTSLLSGSDKKEDSNAIITIGSIGRLNWAKDFYTLLDAFQYLTNEFKNIKLMIVGGGELEMELMHYSKHLGVYERVVFMGDTPNVKPALSEIDIFVSSSVSEGYSIALLEACAVGIPIVATDVGGNAEIVKNNVNGFVVPAKDKVALADKIAKLIRDKSIRDRFAESGKDWVIENGDVSGMLSNYCKLYSECI